jgi:hypothetical protein
VAVSTGPDPAASTSWMILLFESGLLTAVQPPVKSHQAVEQQNKQSDRIIQGSSTHFHHLADQEAMVYISRERFQFDQRSIREMPTTPK